MTLLFMVRYQTLSLIDTKMEPRQGSSNYLDLKFNFTTKDWKSLRKTVYLSSGEYSTPFILESDILEVPPYFTQQGSFVVTLLGDGVEGQVVPTNELVVALEPSNNLWTAQPPDPENSAYVQMLKVAENAMNIAQSVRDDVPVSGAPGQVLTKTEEGNQWRTPSGGEGSTDISLGMTTAKVGQIAKIKSVDASGKPTEWEPVDLSSGSVELVNEITTNQATATIMLNVDKKYDEYFLFLEKRR